MASAARRRARRTATALSALALTATLAACSGSGSDEDEPTPSTPADSAAPVTGGAAPAAVALTEAALPDGVTIGLVASLTSAPGEGSQWRAPAEGAQVAAYRFQQAGADVRVIAADDRGTSAGATRAVQSLIDQGVAGIVVASSGDHLDDALAAAAVAQVPVLLPYDVADTADLPVGVWLTGPDAAAESAALTAAIESVGGQKPLLVDAGGPEVAGTLDKKVNFASGQRDRALVGRVERARAAGTGVVVVSGPASVQALAVRALQGAGIDLPVVLTPDALSPVLATDLVAEGGSLASDLITVGTDTGDSSALRGNDRGKSLAAYFVALAGAAGDTEVTDFFDGRSFATAALDADTRSHDAVVALVRAVGVAGSTDAGAVTAALSSMSLSAEDGLVGPPLDFSDQAALAESDVVPLRATPQDPGVRPSLAKPEPRLYWFPVPQSRP